ncbi:hypothetical protein DB347_23880 [Opitutaceae bacterium EW11]|nr:hypothetical protein DB347_23880 [Opitutaceae bacterium EW11]
MTPQAERKLKILVVDDEPMIRNTCGSLLRAAGFEPVEGESAEQGLQQLEAGDISLVISDIQMPGNENLRFLRDINRLYPGLPVILLTAFPTLDTAIQSFSLATAYLVKPPEAEQLLLTIQQSLGQYEARKAVEHSLSRLKEWMRDLEKLTSLLSGQRNATDIPAAHAFIELSLQNLTSSLHDVGEVVAVLAASPGGVSNLRSFELEKAVRETISVLEATKRTFKSKELGQLRERLETLLSLQESGNGDQ